MDSERRRGYDNVPTQVGVYRDVWFYTSLGYKCPHASGGVPSRTKLIIHNNQMSPRKWGCTVWEALKDLVATNVPTQVGVYRTKTGQTLQPE